MSSFRVALVQLNSSADKQHNLSRVEELVQQAVESDAHLVVLPELFNCLAQPWQVVEQAEPIPGPTSQWLGRLAAQWHVTLLGGSIAEQAPQSDKIYNTSLLFGPDGTQLASYRKIHLFEVDLPGKVSLCEADFMLPGEETVVTDTPVGRLGQATCYDLRFPELFRQLVDRGAQFVTLPSAFTSSTGPDHWEVLLRARAIENQIYILAPNQYGEHAATLHSYGRSMIVDPWGVVLATASDGERVITAEIDLALQEEVRQCLPSLKNRRLS